MNEEVAGEVQRLPKTTVRIIAILFAALLSSGGFWLGKLQSDVQALDQRVKGAEQRVAELEIERAVVRGELTYIKQSTDRIEADMRYVRGLLDTRLRSSRPPSGRPAVMSASDSSRPSVTSRPHVMRGASRRSVRAVRPDIEVEIAPPAPEPEPERSGPTNFAAPPGERPERQAP